MRVLVAEDDKPVASFLRKGLEAENYAVDVAGDGKEAMYMADQFDYDLVILDLGLPESDGLGRFCCRRWKSNSSGFCSA